MRIAIVDDCENERNELCKRLSQAHFQGHIILKFADTVTERIF